MDAGTLSVRKIFGQDRRHVVPLFQRPYVWTRNAQWAPLWEDVSGVAQRLLEGHEPRPHFLGAIVLDQIPKPYGHVETRLVIDGQQRLTTIQILLEAFCDYCQQAGAEKHHKALLKLTRNDDPLSEDPDEQFKVWPTNLDQEHFRRVMSVASPTELRRSYGIAEGKSVDQNIADGYLYFYEAVSSWMDQDNTGFEQRVDALFKTLGDYLRLVVIDLDVQDDAQLIFETLNARGTPLLPSDLVKNFLFHRAQSENDSLDKLYKQYWRPFDEDASYWREFSGRGRQKRPRIDMFLQSYLTIARGEEVSVAHLYATFREHATSQQDVSAQDLLKNLAKYAKVYRTFESLPPGSAESVFFSRLAAMDVTTAYPLLLELLVTHGSGTPAVKAILKDLDSFLVRRMVCQLSTRGYNRLFTELLKAVLQAQKNPAETVRSFLLSSEADHMRWPSDREFRDAWLDTPAFKALARTRVRMLLEALEVALHSDKTEKLSFKEALTIEHLMPRNWQKHWPMEGDDDEAERRRERLLHSLGNLTLLTNKLNPAVSNGMWSKKRPQILKFSALALNQSLQECEVWDEQCIQQRGEELFKIARKIWPFPKV